MSNKYAVLTAVGVSAVTGLLVKAWPSASEWEAEKRRAAEETRVEKCVQEAGVVGGRYNASTGMLYISDVTDNGKRVLRYDFRENKLYLSHVWPETSDKKITNPTLIQKDTMKALQACIVASPAP